MHGKGTLSHHGADYYFEVKQSAECYSVSLENIWSAGIAIPGEIPEAGIYSDLKSANS
jgi:hypothetical protein